MKNYHGDLIIKAGDDLSKYEDLESVSGSVDVRENAKASFPKLESVSGYVDVRENAKLEKQLWKITINNKWYITEKSSQWLIDKNGNNFEYRLHDVVFSREWFLKIKNDKLTAEEVFAIDNIEHRRVAYEFMDKSKMKQIKDFKVLDEKKDEKGNVMKIVSFTVQNMDKPLKFYNCICPSSKREYFVGTDKTKCDEAKAASFGLVDCEFANEW